MKTPRWIEHPRMLALLTLAFSLVPAGFAFMTFRAARERDARLFDTAAEVLAEQLKINSLRHQNFLNIMRNQWRYVDDSAHPPKGMPPAGWETRITHLRAVAFASHEDEKHIRILWQQGRSPAANIGDNLADDQPLADAMRQARLSTAPLLFGTHVSKNSLVVVGAVTSHDDNTLVRGYVLGWLDLDSFCRDPSLPLLNDEALRAAPVSLTDPPVPGERRKLISDGENKVEWTVAVTRGSGFSREYGTPTPWIGFAALALSVVPLSILVIIASRAGKLRAALDAERELGRMKNQFVSSVSHEFRTPLSVILSGAELLEVHASQLSDSRRGEVLAQIKSSTERMNEMVEQVLLLGRIESGTMKANPQPVDVAALCREIVEEVQIATQRRCEIETQLDEVTHSLDAALLRSALANLLTNAVKYSKPGRKVALSLRERSETPPSQATASNHRQFSGEGASPAHLAEQDGYCTASLLITITDEGIGIPAADQARLGEPFHRAANVGDITGTGLGLAVVKRCLSLCGGTLSISSEEGRGTIAIVTIPFAGIRHS